MTSKMIYHAGASADIDRIERENASLVAAGWKLTFDWTVPVRKAGTGSPDDLKVQTDSALSDLVGVALCNVMWLAQPDASSTSTGAWVELGASLERRRIYKLVVAHSLSSSIASRFSMAPEDLDILPVAIVVSGSSRKCIFSNLADYRFQSHEDALEFIIKDLR